MKTNVFICLIFIITFFNFKLFGQKNDKNKNQLNYEILINNNYSLNQILNDSTLKFVSNETLNPKYESFWIKLIIENSSNYSQNCYLNIYPFVDNTLYNFNEDIQKWEEKSNGFLVKQRSRNVSNIPLVLNPKKENIVYIKMNVKKSQFSLFPSFRIEKQEVILEKEEKIWIVWFVTIGIILFFFIYNSYLYFLLYDKTYFLYLTILLGGFLYITSFIKIFNVFIEYNFLTFEITKNSNFYTFDINNLFNYIGTYIVIFGFTQLTRSFLETSKYLPFEDKLLKYLYAFYFILSLIFLFTNLMGYYLDRYTAYLSNLLILLIILSILYTSFKSKKRGNKLANYFLMACIIPLILIFILAIYVNFYINVKEKIYYYPNLILISYSLSFAIALAARVNLIKDELKLQQIEAQKLINENEKMVLTNQLVQLEKEQIEFEIALEKTKNENLLSENQNMQIKNKLMEVEKERINSEMELEKIKNENLNIKIEYNQRELTSSTLFASQTNEMLETLKKQIDEISLKNIVKDNEIIQKIKETIQNNLVLDNNWDKFKMHFEQVHPDFFVNLLDKFPNLTPNEVRLCAYFHLKLTIKEISALQNIDPNSVRKAKSRMNKKMNLPEEIY